MDNKRIYELKPDFDDAHKRLEAYWEKEVLDRPVLLAAVKKDASIEYIPGDNYYDRIYGDLETIVKNKLSNARNTVYLGEYMPGFWTSLGTHEIATHCGYDVEWASHTNWCKNDGRELRDILPLKLDRQGDMYTRALEVYDKVAEIAEGRLLPYSFDFHSNLDLLLSVRGDSELCYDTIDCPELVDKGIENSCELFSQLWNDYLIHSKGEEYGYFFELFSDKPTTSLACDFAALIGEEMFNRFAVPALKYESEVVGKRAIFHWDGPAALKHHDSIMGIENIHTISYVPNHYETHMEMIEVYKKCQQKGKSIFFTGTVDEIKLAHRELKPHLTCYNVKVGSQKEFEELEKWLRNNM